MNVNTAREHIVTTMRRIYENGYTTTSGGNLSIRADSGDICITPSGVDKGGLAASDIIVVHSGGSFDGPHKPSMELPFHRLVYQLRPDVGAVLHAHPPALVAYSAVRRPPDTNVLHGIDEMVGRIAVAAYGTPGSDALAESVGRLFGDGADVVLLENHGVTIAGATMTEAYRRFDTLERMARAQIAARRLGSLQPLGDALPATPPSGFPTFEPAERSDFEQRARERLCLFVARSLKAGLVSAATGRFSHRLSHNAFLVTPKGGDRAVLTPDDLVTIRDGRCEHGKIPDDEAVLFDRLYRDHNGLNAILFAQPVYLSALAMTRTPFPLSMIPESRMMLREVRQLTCDALFDPELLSDAISVHNPVALIENGGLLAAGENSVRAFDRLEVAEFAARAYVGAFALGGPVMMDDREVDDLRRGFHLE